MKKLRVYLDTSVINFLFADDAPEKREITHEFFEKYVRLGKVECFISSVVVDEIGQTRDVQRRTALNEVLGRYGLPLLAMDGRPEILNLAKVFVWRGIIPARKPADALHLAVAAIHEMDVLASWNYHHLANVNKERRVLTVCQEAGYYYPMRLTTPLEVMGL